MIIGAEPASLRIRPGTGSGWFEKPWIDPSRVGSSYIRVGSRTSNSDLWTSGSGEPIMSNSNYVHYIVNLFNVISRRWWQMCGQYLVYTTTWGSIPKTLHTPEINIFFSLITSLEDSPLFKFDFSIGVFYPIITIGSVLQIHQDSTYKRENSTHLVENSTYKRDDSTNPLGGSAYKRKDSAYKQDSLPKSLKVLTLRDSSQNVHHQSSQKLIR